LADTKPGRNRIVSLVARPQDSEQLLGASWRDAEGIDQDCRSVLRIERLVAMQRKWLYGSPSVLTISSASRRKTPNPESL
jgi:hypothetical protein